MNPEGIELTVHHLTGKVGSGRMDAAAIDFVCTCGTHHHILQDGPPDYSPGSLIPLTGGFAIDCAQCGSRYLWNCNSTEILVEVEMGKA